MRQPLPEPPQTTIHEAAPGFVFWPSWEIRQTSVAGLASAIIGDREAFTHFARDSQVWNASTTSAADRGQGARAGQFLQVALRTAGDVDRLRIGDLLKLRR